MWKCVSVSVIAATLAFTLAAPAVAQTKADKLHLALKEARTALVTHQQNVVLLEAECAKIEQRIAKLVEQYEQTGKPEFKEQAQWEAMNLERHQLRLAQERRAVVLWADEVSRLEAAIKAAQTQSGKGKTGAELKVDGSKP